MVQQKGRMKVCFLLKLWRKLRPVTGKGGTPSLGISGRVADVGVNDWEHNGAADLMGISLCTWGT